MRQDESNCSLTVDGERVPILFSTRGGGGTAAEEVKHRPAGGMPQEARGGPASTENVTLSGEFRPSQHAAVVKRLRSRCGRGRAEVVEQFIDEDGNAFGISESWTGKIQSVNTGEYDSNSGEIRLIEIEISTDERTA